MTPQVSIVLPTYNGARYLAESLTSCLQQSYQSLEVIVVVDGSTDETEAVLARFSDARLRIIRTENQGLPRALNTGFAAATGSLWSWTSDDNLYEPGAIAEMVGYLEAHPSVPMVCTDLIVINDAGIQTGYSATTWACFLYRREAAERTGPYRPEFSLVEDVDFFVRLQHFAGPIARIQAPFYRYRTHGQTLSAKQLRRRHLASLRLHYDLITRGIEKESLRELFFHRLSQAAMQRGDSTMDEIVAFAREKNVPFLSELLAADAQLRTATGWLRNRLVIAVRSRVERARQRLALWRHRGATNLGRVWPARRPARPG